MRSYMGNAKCADTIVPMALNTRPARQRSSCADASGRQHPACFALFRQKKSPNLRLLQVPFSSPTKGLLKALFMTLPSKAFIASRPTYPPPPPSAVGRASDL